MLWTVYIQFTYVAETRLLDEVQFLVVGSL